MECVITGLGNYEHVLARELPTLRHEVIGTGISESRVDSIRDKVATAFVIDVMDEQSLLVPPLNGVDIITMAIGENFGASIRVVTLLKQKKMPRIFARIIDAVRKVVLEAFSLEKTLTPEEDAAHSLVQLLDLGATTEAFRTGQGYYIARFIVPRKSIGYFVSELNMDEEPHLKLIELKRTSKIINRLGIFLMELHIKNELPGDEKVEGGDELACYGKYRDFQSFWKAT